MFIERCGQVFKTPSCSESPELVRSIILIVQDIQNQDHHNLVKCSKMYEIHDVKTSTQQFNASFPCCSDYQKNETRYGDKAEGTKKLRCLKMR